MILLFQKICLLAGKFCIYRKTLLVTAYCPNLFRYFNTPPLDFSFRVIYLFFRSLLTNVLVQSKKQESYIIIIFYILLKYNNIIMYTYKLKNTREYTIRGNMVRTSPKIWTWLRDPGNYELTNMFFLPKIVSH